MLQGVWNKEFVFGPKTLRQGLFKGNLTINPAKSRMDLFTKRVKDIKDPARSVPGPEDIPVRPAPGRRRFWRRLGRALGLGLAGVFIALPLLFFAGYFRLRGQVLDSAAHLGTVIQNQSQNLPWAGLVSFLPNAKGTGFADLMPQLMPLLRSAGDSYQALQVLAASATRIADGVAYLEENGLNLMLTGQGREVLGKLIAVRDSLAETYDATGKIPAEGEGGAFLEVRMALGRARDFLSSLIAWLDASGPRRLAILLENSAEMRPGGGFLGSYVELTLEKGSITGITVRDINEADRELDLRTVPPRQLQGLVRNWRAADSNWFFDFSASAEKTLHFLDASGLYRTSDTFAGAIAISPKVVGDLLALTGPIGLPSGQKLDQATFLRTLQAEVENGQIAGADAPKGILSEAAPVLLGKLRELDQTARGKLLDLMSGWAEGKDLRIYIRDKQLQRFAEDYGLAGRPAELAQGWNGAYLAVANANIGGGKTDTIMDQSVDWQVQFTAEGLVRTHLKITRKNTAGASDAWWYTMPNADFLQVFATPGSKLTYAEGGRAEKITPKTDYARNGYAKDAQVAALEATRTEYAEYPQVQGYQQSGKQVFATWTRTERGGKSAVVLDYEHRATILPQAGARYELVFDKQPASRSTYHFEASAPIGYVFEESGSPIFEYKSDDPAGQLVVPLTLRKVQI